MVAVPALSQRSASATPIRRPRPRPNRSSLSLHLVQQGAASALSSILGHRSLMCERVNQFLDGSDAPGFQNDWFLDQRRWAHARCTNRYRHTHPKPALTAGFIFLISFNHFSTIPIINAAKRLKAANIFTPDLGMLSVAAAFAVFIIAVR